MSVFLGELGRLVGLRCPSSEVSSSGRLVSVDQTLGGRGVAWSLPRGLRSWQVKTSAASRPEDLAALQGFVDGEWGPGPWVWVSHWAQVTNLLTPLAAAGGGWSNGSVTAGAVVLPGGSVAGRRGLVSSSLSYVLDAAREVERVPVRDGVPVSFGVWVLPTGGVPVAAVISWRDQAGAQVSVSAGYSSARQVWQRAEVTGFPPAGAVSALVGVSGGACEVTRPVVTWTDAVRSWSTGAGASAVVVEQASLTPVLATLDTQYAEHTYVLREVG